MKNILSALIAVMFVMGLTLSGMVQGGEYKEGMEHEGMEHEGMEKAHKKAMKGMHQMSGTITAIDKETGVVSLESQPVDLELHFPPQAIQDLEEGDEITVSLGFRKAKEEEEEE